MESTSVAGYHHGVDYTRHLEADSTRLAALLADVDPATPVPSCSEWTAGDLLWHLGEVQWFWGSIVSERLDAPEPARQGAPERPDRHDDLLDLLGRATDRLVEALEDAEDGEPVWTWHEPDETVGFVRRRQAHEALVHRIDAEQTAGIPGSLIDPDLATDGVDEFLTVVLGHLPRWGRFEPDGEALRVHAADAGRRWGVAFGRFTGTSPSTGTTYDMAAASVGLDAVAAVATVDGRSAELDAWLWGRGGVHGLTLSGERRLVDRLRDLASDSGQ